MGNEAVRRDDSVMGITVVIVDDHAGFRAMARRMLQESGFAVVGEAADGEEAVRTVQALLPRLVLLDIQLPDVDGFTVAQRLAEAGGGEVVVLTSSRAAIDYGSRLALSPARGFISKADLSGPALAEMLGAA